MSKLKKSSIRKEAKQLLYKEGKSKQEIFNLLNDKFHNREKVVDVLHYLPSHNLRNKYKNQELWLIAFL